jgi:hypothetical protein
MSNILSVLFLSLFGLFCLFFTVLRPIKKNPTEKIQQQINFMPTVLDRIVNIYVSEGINVKSGMAEFSNCQVKNCLINQNSKEIIGFSSTIFRIDANNIRYACIAANFINTY